MPHDREKQDQFNEYNRTHYDVIATRFNKEDNVRPLIQKAADIVGVNMNGFLKCALMKAVEEVLLNNAQIEQMTFKEYVAEKKPALKALKYKPKKRRNSVLNAIKEIKAEQHKAEKPAPQEQKAKSSDLEM